MCSQLETLRKRASGIAPRVVVGLLCMFLAGRSPVRADDDRSRRDEIAHAAPIARTVVLSDSCDAYYALASDIARDEGIPLVHSREEIARMEPVFVIWVLSPPGLSESDIARTAAGLWNGDAPISWGIITGSTLEMARGLYERSPSAMKGWSLVDARRGVIVLHGEGSEQSLPLEIDGLSRLLRNTACLAFSGRGGGSYWRLSEETLLTADDIPPLPPLVVSSGACRTFSLQMEKSIALGFTDRGAAAYAGFLFSPAPHYLFGHPDDFPLRHAWPGFPVGFIVSMQGGGTLDSYARFPFYCLLGDPRLAFSSSEPYRLVEDAMEGEVRLLRFAALPQGYVPVRIAGGAAYSFVEVVDLVSAGRDDLFYNSKLQAMDLGGDKLILVAHGGGDLAVRLHRREPILWHVVDAATDALDHAYVYLPHAGGKTFFIVVSACILFATLWFTLHIGLRPIGFRAALLIGAILAGSKGIYAFLRLGRTSIVSMPLALEPHFFIGVFILAGCGALLFFNVRSIRWKAAAVLVATFPTWAVAAFWLAGIAYVNLFGASPRPGMHIYSYTLGFMPALAFAVECLFVVPVFSVTAGLSKDGAE